LYSTDKKSKKRLSYISILRISIQIISFLLINYIILELIFQIDIDIFEGLIKILPILNSPRNPISNGAGFVEFIMYMISQAEFPFLILGLLILISLLFSRIFCGFVCPIGTIQDFLGLFRSKKRKFSKKTHNTLINIKFIILIIIGIAMITLGASKLIDPVFYFDYRTNLGAFAEKPLGYFSLSEYLFVFLPTVIQDIFTTGSFESIFTDFLTGFFFFFYIIVLILALYYPRVYCRYLCPFAAASAIFSEYSFLKLSRNPVKCAGRKECGICETVCPMQIRILDEKFEGFTGGGECILCFRCVDKCPNRALKIKFG
jgi:ferredoxin-type protein NapH